jgi:uncharacterized cysteine cluster protein YcgN (CxxCxxCC family)
MSDIIPGTPEWESICAQCGLCCLVKYTDNLGRVFLTNIRCDMLDPKTHKCKCYSADVNERDNNYGGCLENGGSALNWDTLFNAYVVPGCCKYVQKFGNHDLVKRCAKPPKIDMEKDTVPESEVPRDKYAEHVIPGSHKYFKHNPLVNEATHKACMILNR